MKRLLWLTVGMILLTACQQTEPIDNTVRIGISVYKGEDTYISSMTSTLQEIVADYTAETGENIYLTILDADESQSTQNGQIERFLSLGYDVLLVNIVDRTDAARVVDKAQTADVPIIFFNREPVQEDLMAWGKAFYLGSDARESAVLQANIVLDLWENDRAALDKNGDGVLQYVMLEGEIRHQDTIIRTEVPIQTLKDAGISVERLGGGVANWNRNQAAALTELCFEQHRDAVEVIFCNNDDMALGAVDAMTRLGTGFTNIVGIDGTPQGVEAVAKQHMLGTVVMDYPAHAKTLLQMALALVREEDVTQVVDIGSDHAVRIPMNTRTRDD